VLQRRQGRAGGKHPAAEQGQLFLARAIFGDFDKGGVFRLLLGRAFFAVAHHDRQRAEIHDLSDRRVEAGNPRGNLVEPLHHRDRLGGGLGRGARPRQRPRDQRDQRNQRPERWHQPHWR